MFISYAQNLEDVVLWRALQHVDSGFYIDIGAAWPDQDSVTKAFYDHGWRGVNIEPNPALHRLLEEDRPTDTNLPVAIGIEDGSLTINVLQDTGLSTLDDSIAETHKTAGWKVERREVQVITLTRLWREYVPENQDVHFLKVDVEGFESAVLKGNNWTCNRPWIVVVEATLPRSQIESHAEWEPILLNADYLFAYADGLNRFYVAREHEALLPAFKYPPNVFDDFKLSSQQQAEEKAQQAEEKAQRAEEKVQQALTQLDAVYASTSWRITAPLRWINFQLRRLRRHKQ